MYSIEFTGKFKKDFERCKRRNYDISKIEAVFKELIETGTLSATYKPHKLVGNFNEKWECHITPDWLLIYEKSSSLKLISLIRTGTHSDLF